MGRGVLARNVYECLYLLDSNRYARDPAGVTASIPSMVEKLGGEMLASRLWNEQKLAYPIRGQRKGTYWLAYFRLDSDKIVNFNRACQLSDPIMRNMVLKVELRLVDALVSHALGKTSEPKADVNAESSEPAPADANTETPAVVQS